jgi:hypothetical protein
MVEAQVENLACAIVEHADEAFDRGPRVRARA